MLLTLTTSGRRREAACGFAGFVLSQRPQSILANGSQHRFFLTTREGELIDGFVSADLAHSRHVTNMGSHPQAH
jgi:hypothetical protein